VALLAPVLFTSRAFGPDWNNHLYVLWKQSRSIDAMGHPSLFVSNDLQGVLYPQFAFYGGTLYSIFGAIASILGGRVSFAYTLGWLTGMLATFAGWAWLAQQAGLRGWRVFAPALFSVTGAYFLTLIYSRSGWGEFIATGVLPLVIASGVWLLRAPRWRVLPLGLFLGSTVILSGSHNITLMWGAVCIVGVAVVAAVAFGRSLGGVRPRRIATVVGTGLLAVAVNAWFLVPDLVYSSKTLIGTTVGDLDLFWDYTSFFNTPGELFHPLRHVPAESTTPNLYVQLPIFAVLWLAGAGAVAVRRARTMWVRRMIVGLWVLFLVILSLHMTKVAWQIAPETLMLTQLPFRVQTYLLGSLTGLLLLTLLALREPGLAGQRWVPRAHAALAVVLAFGFSLAMWQVASAPQEPTTMDVVYTDPGRVPPSWYDPGYFRDQTAPVLEVEPGRQVALPLLDGDTVSADIALPQGDAPFLTNIATGDYLIDVRGLRLVGREPKGLLVATREPGDVGTTTHVEISPKQSAPVVAGRYITFAALLGVAGLLIGVALRGRRDDAY
jgi:hypothetical protein